MYENDPIGQLVNVIMPRLITKIKEQKDTIAQLEERMVSLENNDAFYREALDAMNREISALRDMASKAAAATLEPKPEVKKRAPRKKKQSVLVSRPDKLTTADVLYANHALVATNGNIELACAIEPSVPQPAMAYVEQMTTDEVMEMWNPDELADVTDVPHEYSRGNWRDVKKLLANRKG